MSAHVVSVVTYGVTVNGPLNNAFVKVKTIVRSIASTRVGGGSMTDDLMLQWCKKADLGCAANTLFILISAILVNIILRM